MLDPQMEVAGEPEPSNYIWLNTQNGQKMWTKMVAWTTKWSAHPNRWKPTQQKLKEVHDRNVTLPGDTVPTSGRLSGVRGSNPSRDSTRQWVWGANSQMRGWVRLTHRLNKPPCCAAKPGKNNPANQQFVPTVAKTSIDIRGKSKSDLKTWAQVLW